MANETRKYLDHLAKRTADTATGIIIERMPDGTYLYADVATGAERFATTANPLDEFAINSRVRIDRPSAGRGVVGAQDVIQSRAPREQRGLSATTPSVDRDGFDRAVIVSVDPDPLILTAGGEPGVQVITGHGFDEAATYFERGDGPDPDLTDDDPPVVTDTSVTMTIAAEIDSPRGDFAVNVSGAVAGSVLRIVAPAAVGYGFFVVGFGAGATTLATIRDFNGTMVATQSASLGGTIHRFVQIDNTTFLVFFTLGGGRLVIIDAATGEFTLAPIGTYPVPTAAVGLPTSQIAVHNGFAYYGDDNGQYVEVNLTTGAIARVLKAIAGAPVFGSSCYDPISDSLFTSTNINGTGSGETGARLRRFARVAGTETQVLLGVTSAVRTPNLACMATDGNVVYARRSLSTTAGTFVLAKFNPTTLALISETASVAVLNQFQVCDIFEANGEVFVPFRNIGGTAGRAVRRFPDDISGSDHETAGSVETIGSDAVLVPADENPASAALLYRVLGTAGGPMILRAHLAFDASFSSVQSEVTCTAFAGESAAYGLGWTATP